MVEALVYGRCPYFVWAGGLSLEDPAQVDQSPPGQCPAQSSASAYPYQKKTVGRRILFHHKLNVLNVNISQVEGTDQFFIDLQGISEKCTTAYPKITEKATIY